MNLSVNCKKLHQEIEIIFITNEKINYNTGINIYVNTSTNVVRKYYTTFIIKFF